MSSKAPQARKAGTGATKASSSSKATKSTAEMNVDEDDFGGYGSDDAHSAAAKKPKTATSKTASGSTTQDRAKKPTTARDEKMVDPNKEEEEQPRKRTSSRLQGKGKGNDVSQSSAIVPVKSINKATHSKASHDAGNSCSEDDMEESDMRSRLKEMTNEMAKMRSHLDKCMGERDNYAKQVKELKDKRMAVTDELYDKYKAAADSRATAQDEVIQTMQKINDKLSSRVASLEKELVAAKSAKVVEKEAKPPPDPDADALKRLKATLQAVEEASKQKDVQLKEYETEVKLAKDALASANKKLVTAQSASSTTRDAEETAKDSDVIKWYEDLTNLVVLSVKVHNGDCGREVTFVCVETLAEHSLSFRARCYTTAKEDPAKAGTWLYTKQVDYTPIGLEAEKDAAFLARLEMLRDPFTFTRDQAYAFMANLQEKMTTDEEAE